MFFDFLGGCPSPVSLQRGWSYSWPVQDQLSPSKDLPTFSSFLVLGREERPVRTGNPDPTSTGGERNTAAWVFVKVKSGLANTKISATGVKMKTNIN